MTESRLESTHPHRHLRDLLRKGCQMGDKDACDVLRQLNVPE